MKRLFLIVMLMTGLFCLWSCGGGKDQVDERLESAESAIIRGDMVAAESLADAVAEDDGNMSVDRLGRLSILYMKIGETATDNSDYVAKAARCYRAAFELNADSASVFYTDIDIDDVPYVMTLSLIVSSADNPTAMPDETADSLYADSIFHFHTDEH